MERNVEEGWGWERQTGRATTLPSPPLLNILDHASSQIRL